MSSFFQLEMVETIKQELKRLELISETEYKAYVSETVSLIKQDLDFIRGQLKNGYSVKSEREQDYFKRLTDNSLSKKMIDDYF